MANEKKMDRAILGFLNHEPMTGYDIKKRIDTTLHLFWGGSYGSIYTTLSTLENDGYVTKKATSDNKREKITYYITESGRSYLQTWLLDMSAKDELRYETLLKLFFSGTLGKDLTLKRIEAFEMKIKSELPMIEFSVSQLEQLEGNDPDHLNFLLTAKFGVETYHAYLRWCEGAKELLNSYAD